MFSAETVTERDFAHLYVALDFAVLQLVFHVLPSVLSLSLGLIQLGRKLNARKCRFRVSGLDYGISAKNIDAFTIVNFSVQ